MTGKSNKSKNAKKKELVRIESITLKNTACFENITIPFKERISWKNCAFLGGNLQTVFTNFQLHNKTILEAGCGAGTMTNFLLSQNAEKIIAVSNREEDLDYCRQQIPPRDISRVEFVEGNLLNLPEIASSSVDMVTAYFLFNVIKPTDVRRLMMEIKRFLKPGGILVIVDYTPFDFYEDDSSRVQRELWNLENALSVLSKGEMTYYEYPPEWTVENLESIGFEVLKKDVPITKVLWRKELLREHGEGIHEQINGLKEVKLREALLMKLNNILKEVDEKEVHSGQIFSIVAVR